MTHHRSYEIRRSARRKKEEGVVRRGFEGQRGIFGASVLRGWDMYITVGDERARVRRVHVQLGTVGQPMDTMMAAVAIEKFNVGSRSEAEKATRSGCG